MLGEMRNRAGAPNVLMRALALLLALLLAGPVALVVLRAAVSVLGRTL